MRRLGYATVVLLSLVVVQSASADFISFVIRTGPGPGNNPPVINTLPGPSTEFVITEGGQKAGLGSSDIDGFTLGSITNLSIDRLDDPTRFTAGTGPAVAPYLNFWITDGLGNFAVVANEPSNPDFQALYSGGYQLDFSDLSDKVANIHENADKTWLPNNGVGLTFADLAAFTIQAPSVAQLTIGWAGLGTGAPRELGTNQAYGVNWVFGDTLANYVSGDDGYIVANAAVSVPDAGSSLLLLMLGFGSVVATRWRRA